MLSERPGGVGPEPADRWRVMIIDDHLVFASSLSLALESEGLETTIAEYFTEAALVETALDFGADVILLDEDLGPGYPTGSSLIATFTGTGAGVIMLSAAFQKARAAEWIAAGAIGALPKNSSLDRVADAIERATRLGTALLPGEADEFKSKLLKQQAAETARLEPFTRLTTRERQVLHALAQGSSAAEIAQDWYVAVSTVRGHIKGLLIKLGVNSQLAAVALARNEGWLNPTTPPNKNVA